MPESASGRGVKDMQSSATLGPALVLHSDADRREFISAGAAGGLAVCLILDGLGLCVCIVEISKVSDSDAATSSKPSSYEHCQDACSGVH